MDMAPGLVQQNQKSESSSSKKEVIGERSEKTSSRNIDAVPTELVADTDGTSISPKEKAIVNTAPLQRSTVTKQKEAVKDVVTVGEGAETISCPNTDAVPAELVADADGTSTIPKLTLTIKEETAQK